ncbi:MAG: GntR family transcriptional regulator [Arenicella sp.]|jgi:GntR family transcriptional regulator
MSLSTNFQPLYKQVYDRLIGRIADGYWKPAAALPSEFALADELGVSQGTVRKALNQLVAENILIRRQGKGTYVSEHTQESSMFRFFRYREAGGEDLIPITEIVDVERRTATKREAKKLNLDKLLDLVQVTRIRSINGKPAIFERVLQPLAIFPGIDTETELPNSLYTLYQEKYNISIVEVRDELQAVSLPADIAAHLNLAADSPVLMTERSSINIDGRVAEWSQAYCSTDNFVYSVSLK